MKKRQTVINIIMSILQIIVVGGAWFFLYRFLLRTIGVEKIGVWSLVLASTSAMQFANLGLPGSVVRFVAKYAARNNHQAVSRLLQTTLIAVGLSLGLLLLLLYPLAERILVIFVDASALPDALPLLPFAAGSVWLMNITAVASGALDGYQRIDLRSGLRMLGVILYTSLCFVLVGRYSLLGLAYAQLIQYIFLLIGNLVLLRRYVTLPLVPYQWDTRLFKETFSYGVNYQVIGLTQIMYDPVTRAFLALFGGLAMVGFYEMASKMVTQLRSLVVSANGVLIPVFADLKEREPEQVRRVYLESSRVVFFVAVPLYTLTALIIPIVSKLWVGYYEPVFVISGWLLSLGWFINTLTAPAYFAYLGNGRLRWNTLSHVAITIINIILSWFLGSQYGGSGVLVGWALALGSGSLMITIAFHMENGCNWKAWFSLENLILTASSTLALIFALFAYNRVLADTPISLQVIVMAAMFLGFNFIPLWNHSVRLRLYSIIAGHVYRTKAG